MLTFEASHRAGFFLMSRNHCCYKEYLTVARHEIQISVSFDGECVTCEFTVDGSYDATNIASYRETKISIIRAVMSRLRQLADEFPNGTTFIVKPFEHDRSYKSRVKLFLRVGFSEPDRCGEMWSMKVNNKLIPA